MKTPIERIRLSATAQDQLIKLKRSTGIEQWNILCRWAFCHSLAKADIPSPTIIPADSNVEMTWNVFGGEIADILLIALKQKCHQDRLGTDQETLRQQFRLHLHRGINDLAEKENLQNIEDLINIGL